MRFLDPIRLVKTAAAPVVVAATLLACSSTPPPTPPPESKPKEEPPPPPPPKCEAMKDKCKAKADTRVPIPGSDLVFTPPKGWIYAKLEEASVTQAGEKGAVLVLTTLEPDKGPKLNKQRAELAVSLSELVGIDPGGSVSLFNPNSRSEIAGMQMSLWERASASRSDDKGALLILSAPDGDRELFGIGFAPKDDTDGTQAILETLNTLERDKGAEDKTDDGK